MRHPPRHSSNIYAGCLRDEGIFSPDKWIEHHWIATGVEDRFPQRKPLISELPSGSERLTPQRKSFAAGCSGGEGAVFSRGSSRQALNGVDFRPPFVSDLLSISV